MSLKPTLRKNGAMHATITHRFHPSRGFVVMVIAGQFWDDSYEMKPPTKAAVEEAVRDQYLHHGLECEMGVMDDLTDAVGAEYEDEALQWAEEQMVRLWPEWSKR